MSWLCTSLCSLTVNLWVQHEHHVALSGCLPVAGEQRHERLGQQEMAQVVAACIRGS